MKKRKEQTKLNLNLDNSIKEKLTKRLLTVSLAATLASSVIAATPQTNYFNPNFSESTHYTIAHAGGGLVNEKGKLETYLNCEESFYKYYEDGTRMFEYDLIFSSDGELIGIHNYEYFDGHSFKNRVSYDEYINTKIAGKYTGMTSQKLLDLIEKYPDCKFIIDTKEKNDYAVYEKFISEAEERNIDISKSVLPFVSSEEMLNQLENRYNFEEYMFTNYKKNYSTNKLLEIFESNDKIKYLHVFYYDFVKLDIDKINKTGIRVFAHMDKSDLFENFALEYGCSGFFTDDTTENYFLENNKSALNDKFNLKNQTIYVSLANEQEMQLN